MSISCDYGICNEKILGTTRISWRYDGIARIANNFQDGLFFLLPKKDLFWYHPDPSPSPQVGPSPAFRPDADMVPWRTTDFSIDWSFSVHHSSFSMRFFDEKNGVPAVLAVLFNQFTYDHLGKNT